jgi:hypothetical protein
MNTIEILEPRWHDRVVLVADHKIAVDNEVIIHHHNYPHPIYMNGFWAKQFPLEDLKIKSGGKMKVRAIPLDELIKERIEV